MSDHWPPPEPIFGTVAAPANELIPASLGRRIGAAVLDAMLPLVGLYGFAFALLNVINLLPNDSGEPTGDPVGNPLGLLLLSLCFIAVVFGLGWTLMSKSTSTGKKLFGLYVVDVGTGGPVDFGRMFLRENVCKGLLCLVLAPVPVVAGLVMVLVHPKRSAPWDLMTRTMVVRRK